MEQPDLKLIFNAIESGKCLAFLGAGASTCYFDRKHEEVPGLPTGYKLAELLANECSYSNGKVFDLPKVADYFVYSENGDREKLSRLIQREIAAACKPRPIHTALAQLNKIKIIMTSNYDTLLEYEVHNYGRILTKNVYRRNGSQNALFQGTIFFEERDLILHKMHGSIEDPDSMIITQSDYIQYLLNLNDPDRGMPEYFRKTIIPQFTLLFLGYSLEDWNFKVIWEGVLSRHHALGIHKISYALLKNPSDFQISYWRDRKIKIINLDLTEFAIKLAGHFGLEIPQLGIEKKAEVTQP